MKEGDKIKAFKVISVEKRMVREYDHNNRFKMVEKEMYFLESERGQQRVLREGKTKLDEAEKFYEGTRIIYKRWNQI